MVVHETHVHHVHVCADAGRSCTGQQHCAVQRVRACIETVYDVHKVQKRGKQVYSQCLRRATVADRFSARAGTAKRRRQAELKKS